MLYKIKIVAGLLLVFVCQSVVGFTISGSLSVTANVVGGGQCVLGGVRNMIFPNYSPLSSKPDEATGSITVMCTNNLPYDVGINKGQSAGAEEDHRMVTRVLGNQELEYSLFQEASHAHNYGTALGRNTLHRVGTGSPEVITIYGEIPIHQPVEIGSYTDTVTIFLIF